MIEEQFKQHRIRQVLMQYEWTLYNALDYQNIKNPNTL